jgi:hypothetical protein
MADTSRVRQGHDRSHLVIFLWVWLEVIQICLVTQMFLCSLSLQSCWQFVQKDYRIPSCYLALFCDRKADELKASIDVSEEVVQQFEEFWQRYRDKPFEGRNTLLRNICPQVYGLSTVKLAVALTLIGGVQHVDSSGTRVRGESHLLLVGDPGQSSHSPMLLQVLKSPTSF